MDLRHQARALTVYSIECAEGLRCKGQLGGAFTCQPWAELGQTCSTHVDCADGLACVRDRCGTKGGLGASCDGSPDCEFGLHCDSSDRCTTDLSAGADCSWDVTGCGLGLICSASTQRCVTPSADGTSCTWQYECRGRCDTVADECASICGGTWYAD